jgi:tRNA nucleotidyltransferase (CCA-adding enzyme)
MRQLSESGELQALTAERSWKEISRALMEDQPQVFIQVLRDCGALKVLMPEVDALFGVPQPQASPGNRRATSVLEQAQATAHRTLGVPADDLGKGLTEEEWPRHIAHEHGVEADQSGQRTGEDCRCWWASTTPTTAPWS